MISVSAFSQPLDLKIEYRNFIYTYSGDYVSIIGKLTNVGDVNHKDVTILISLYDKNKQVISREK